MATRAHGSLVASSQVTRAAACKLERAAPAGGPKREPARTLGPVTNRSADGTVAVTSGRPAVPAWPGAPQPPAADAPPAACAAGHRGPGGRFPTPVADRPGEQRMGLLTLFKSHPPRVCHALPLDRLAQRCCRVVVWVVAGDLDDLDEAEGGPQPAEGRELVIVDLGHTTMMPSSGRASPPSWPAPPAPTSTSRR
jgi:hypothetical protein